MSTPAKGSPDKTAQQRLESSIASRREHRRHLADELDTAKHVLEAHKGGPDIGPLDHIRIRLMDRLEKLREAQQKVEDRSLPGGLDFSNRAVTEAKKYKDSKLEVITMVGKLEDAIKAAKAIAGTDGTSGDALSMVKAMIEAQAKQNEGTKGHD